MGDDLHHAPLLALVLPRAIPQTALDPDLASFRQIVRTELRLPIPGGDPEEIGIVALPVAIHGEPERREPLLFAELPQLAPEAATLCAFSGVWRSLVARSVRVGEVPSSNLGTPIGTRGNRWFPRGPLLHGSARPMFVCAPGETRSRLRARERARPRTIWAISSRRAHGGAKASPSASVRLRLRPLRVP